jgi:predicted RNase H-like nuclease (RuvC/YqgF family)
MSQEIIEGDSVQNCLHKRIHSLEAQVKELEEEAELQYKGMLHYRAKAEQAEKTTERQLLYIAELQKQNTTLHGMIAEKEKERVFMERIACLPPENSLREAVQKMHELESQNARLKEGLRMVLLQHKMTCQCNQCEIAEKTLQQLSNQGDGK